MMGCAILGPWSSNNGKQLFFSRSQLEDLLPTLSSLSLSPYVCICKCACTYIYIHIYIYELYTHIERERGLRVYICMCICTNDIYIYTYIHTLSHTFLHTERARERAREREREMHERIRSKHLLGPILQTKQVLKRAPAAEWRRRRGPDRSSGADFRWLEDLKLGRGIGSPCTLGLLKA